MESIKIQAFTLARIVQTGNQTMITNAVKEFEKLPTTADLTQLIDSANLPYLVDVFAPGNKTAIDMIRKHRTMKNAQMAFEKQVLLDKFSESVERKYKNQEVPERMFKILNQMTHIPDSDIVLAFLRLLTNLDISVEQYREVFDFVNDMKSEMPEAEQLFKKIQDKLQDFETVDDEMEIDVESGNMGHFFEHNQVKDCSSDEKSENVEASFSSALINDQIDSLSETSEVPNNFEDFDESISSEESGIENELEEEDLSETEAEFYDRNVELLVMLLAESIKTGVSDVIELAVNLLNDISFNLDMYRRYELTALIRRYAPHCDSAKILATKIDRMDEEVLAKEHMTVFNHIIRCVEDSPKMAVGTMDLSIGYLKFGRIKQADRVSKVLLVKDVSMEQYAEYGAKKILLELPRRTDAMNNLIAKIAMMEIQKG